MVPEALEKKGDLIIQDLCKKGMDGIHEIRVVNTDAYYYPHMTMEKCLLLAEKEKKIKYLEAYLQKCRNFSPFVSSIDGLPGTEPEATLKWIAS